MIDQMVHLLEKYAHHQTWERLADAASLDKVHLQTIRNHLTNEGFCKSAACQKRWLTQEAVGIRVAFSIAHKHSRNEWHSVLFSSSVSFELKTNRKAKMIISHSERWCETCHRGKKSEGKRSEVRATVGYNLKCPLILHATHNHRTTPPPDLPAKKHEQSTIFGKQSIFVEDFDKLLKDQEHEDGFLASIRRLPHIVTYPIR